MKWVGRGSGVKVKAESGSVKIIYFFSWNVFYLSREREIHRKKRTSFVVMCFAAVYFILLCSHACVRVSVYAVECSSNQKHMETSNELHLAIPKFPSHCLLWNEMEVCTKMNFCKKNSFTMLEIQMKTSELKRFTERVKILGFSFKSLQQALWLSSNFNLISNKSVIWLRWTNIYNLRWGMAKFSSIFGRLLVLQMAVNFFRLMFDHYDSSSLKPINLKSNARFPFSPRFCTNTRIYVCKNISLWFWWYASVLDQNQKRECITNENIR